MSPGVIARWFTRRPIPTRPEIELPQNVVWPRGEAKINKTPKRGGSHARELPQELIEMIIAHIQHNAPTLKACSMTCHSWYIATLPYLHHTATLWGQASDPARRGLIPLQELGKMRLLPLVKRLQILQRHGYADPWFLPAIFNTQGLAHFSALTNVRELVIDELDIRTFIPQAQLYFGQFTPTLRSLILRTPRSNHRQLLYFLGLFPNLDDLKLIFTHKWPVIPDLAPVPQLALSLRGRLTLKGFGEEVPMRSLSELSGGLRFRYMDLLNVDDVRFLLDTCADTLEALRVHPVGWAGNRGTVLRDFDLSKSRSLRSLEITMGNISPSSVDALGFLRGLMATITSPVFSDVVFIFEASTGHFPGIIRSTLFWDMYQVKPFRLVLCLWVWGGHQGDEIARFKLGIDIELNQGALGFLPQPPVVVPYTRLAWRQEIAENILPLTTQPSTHNTLRDLDVWSRSQDAGHIL